MLKGEKKLCPLKDLKPVAVGHYPEVSVKALYPRYKDRDEIAAYMPPKVNATRSLDKCYFFNILNTFLHEELQAILTYANQ